VDTEKGAIETEVFEDGVLQKTIVEPGQKVPVEPRRPPLDNPRTLR